MKTCSFCDVWGSAAREESFEMSLQDQMTTFGQKIKARKNSGKFLIYFQAYTSTFQDLQSLRQSFETAAQFPDVVGFVVGTRPDCVSQGVLDLWQEYAEKIGFVGVELGVQSFRNSTLEFYRRGHTHEQSLRAIEKISKVKKVDLGLHLIFGAPEENETDFRNAALVCNNLPISNVKLHNLHVLKNTHLETLWNRGEFNPIDFPSYARAVQVFLEHLNPDTFIQRLAAYSSRWDELVAPPWTADKMRTHQGLIDFLQSENSFQGRHFHSQKMQVERPLEFFSSGDCKNLSESSNEP